jgi:hypothetical protein
MEQAIVEEVKEEEKGEDLPIATQKVQAIPVLKQDKK